MTVESSYTIWKKVEWDCPGIDQYFARNLRQRLIPRRDFVESRESSKSCQTRFSVNSVSLASVGSGRE